MQAYDMHGDLQFYQSQALYAVMLEIERAVKDGAAYLLDIWERTEELRIQRAALATSVPLPGEQDYRNLLSGVYTALATCNTCHMARTRISEIAGGFFTDTVKTSFAHTLLAWLFLRLSQGAFVDWRASPRIRAAEDRVIAVDGSTSVIDPMVMYEYARYRAAILAPTLAAKSAKDAHRALPERVAWEQLDTYCRYIAAQYVYARTSPAERDAVKQLRAVKRDHARHHAAMRRAHGG